MEKARDSVGKARKIDREGCGWRRQDEGKEGRRGQGYTVSDNYQPTIDVRCGRGTGTQKQLSLWGATVWHPAYDASHHLFTHSNNPATLCLPFFFHISELYSNRLTNLAAGVFQGLTALKTL